MKNLIFISVLFFAFTTNAQTYIPMPFEDGMLWRTLTVTTSEAHIDDYTIQGDTTLGTIAYKKAYRNSYTAGTTAYPNPFGLNFIRQDTIAKKVFLHISGSDSLLYDFSLQPGDTIHSVQVTYMQDAGIDTIRIAIIDSVQLNGIYHKRFNSTPINPPGSPLPFTYSYIDGIGAVGGFISFCYQNVCQSDLECVGKVYHQSLYPYSSFNCIFALPTQDVFLKNSVAIYPNPSADIIHIHSSEELVELKISDMFGHILYNNKMYKDNEAIDIKKYPEGVYSIQILLKNQMMLNRTFYKQ